MTQSGCNKPSEEACRKAIVNMSIVMGTEKAADSDINGEIRRCRGGSKQSAVDCAIKASSLDELHACGFSLKARPKKTDKPADKPATPPAPTTKPETK
ncbi:MAG: hypothetical protein NT062_15205 [Proteobacteria bacterium]|nr:hypothetical protein [Pseudomonadota bacterium]